MTYPNSFNYFTPDNALLPILYVWPKTIKYTFNLKLSQKRFLKIGSTCLMKCVGVQFPKTCLGQVSV